jgi:hypothetical protein
LSTDAQLFAQRETLSELLNDLVWRKRVGLGHVAVAGIRPARNVP